MSVPTPAPNLELAHLDNLARKLTSQLNAAKTELQAQIQERYRTEALLSADIAALTRLHELSARSVGFLGPQPLLQEVVNAAVEITNADFGTLRLIEGDTLRIVAHHGHEASFLKFFASAEARASVSGEAMKLGRRVIVGDVESSTLFAGSDSLAVLRKAGVRAVQSTPLMSRSGTMIGILTTQWKHPHTPDEHDLWRVDLLCRQAVELIEQARTQEALRRVAQFPEENPNPVMRILLGGRVDYANAAASKLLADLATSTSGPLPLSIQALVDAVYCKQGPVEFDINTSTGSTFSFVAVRPPGEEYVNLYGRDITERKRAEEALHEHERQQREIEIHRHVLETMTENLPAGIALIRGSDLRILASNPMYQIAVPSRLPDIIGRTIEEVWPEHSSLTAACRYVLTSGKLLRLVDKWFTAGQSPNDTPGRRYWTWSLSRVKLPASDGWGLMSVFIETTERKRAEEALRESEAKLLRLAGGLMEAQESERRKLARELHEDISQRLAAWSLTATALATRDTPRIGELAQQASELCSDIGRIARRLDSSIVETLGLAPALESLCIEFSRIGFLPIDFQKAHSCALEAQTALNLYRIAEEALWNVIQHSDAERASVRLVGGRRAVILTIRDSGRGFDTAQQMGLGLLSIQERVRRLRGTFHLKSQPQHGTELRITIPTQDFQTV